MPTPSPDERTHRGEPPDQDEGRNPLEGGSLFGRDSLVFGYSRAQALEDGVLVDASAMAKEAGFKIPVALTRAAWSEYVEVPKGVVGQDPEGRLWDVLYMCRVAIGRSKSDQPELLFQLHVRNDNRERMPPLVTLKAVCGPGDDGAPVITIMRPEED
jgi:hypothetical protein